MNPIKKSLLLFLSLCFCSITVFGEGSSADQSLPKLLDLGAHKCIPCMKMAPILEELSVEYQGVFDVEFIDVWQAENREKAKAHGIRSIPTQIFFDGQGQELWRHEGFLSKQDILDKWKELGLALEAVTPAVAKPDVSCCGS
jgi:thioredoxin 1